MNKKEDHVELSYNTLYLTAASSYNIVFLLKVSRNTASLYVQSFYKIQNQWKRLSRNTHHSSVIWIHPY